MAMYAVATIPLIKQLGQKLCKLGAAGVGSQTDVQDWWDKIVSLIMATMQILSKHGYSHKGKTPQQNTGNFLKCRYQLEVNLTWAH